MKLTQPFTRLCQLNHFLLCIVFNEKWLVSEIFAQCWLLQLKSQHCHSAITLNVITVGWQSFLNSKKSYGTIFFPFLVTLRLLESQISRKNSTVSKLVKFPICRCFVLVKFWTSWYISWIQVPDDRLWQQKSFKSILNTVFSRK